MSPRRLGVSYTSVSPLPTKVGGLLSVALSVGSLPLGVTQRPDPVESGLSSFARGANAAVCSALTAWLIVPAKCPLGNFRGIFREQAKAQVL